MTTQGSSGPGSTTPAGASTGVLRLRGVPYASCSEADVARFFGSGLGTGSQLIDVHVCRDASGVPWRARWRAMAGVSGAFSLLRARAKRRAPKTNDTHKQKNAGRRTGDAYAAFATPADAARAMRAMNGLMMRSR